MLVKASPGLQCPKENKPREYIDDAAAVDVPDSAYYRRLLGDGSLVKAAKKTQDNPSPQPKDNRPSPLPLSPGGRGTKGEGDFIIGRGSKPKEVKDHGK